MPVTRQQGTGILETRSRSLYVREITSTDGRRVVVDTLLTPSDLFIPFGGEPYVGVIWASDGTFDAIGRSEVVTTLIQSGCRYIVCGGIDCEQWHDDADLAWVNLDLQSDPSRETPFVMTTWHEQKSEEDVLFFAFNCTSFEEHDFSRFLLLVIGHDQDSRTRIERLIEATLTLR